MEALQCSVKLQMQTELLLPPFARCPPGERVSNEFLTRRS